MTKSPLEGGKTQNEGGGRGGGRFWNFGFGNLVCSFRMFVYKCKQFFFFSILFIPRIPEAFFSSGFSVPSSNCLHFS